MAHKNAGLTRRRRYSVRWSMQPNEPPVNASRSADTMFSLDFKGNCQQDTSIMLNEANYLSVNTLHNMQS